MWIMFIFGALFGFVVTTGIFVYLFRNVIRIVE